MIKKISKEIKKVQKQAINHQNLYNKLWSKRADLYRILSILKESKRKTKENRFN